MIKVVKKIPEFDYPDFVKWLGYSVDDTFNLESDTENLCYLRTGNSRRNIYIHRGDIRRLYYLIRMQECNFIYSINGQSALCATSVIKIDNVEINFSDARSSDIYRISSSYKTSCTRFKNFMENIYNIAKKQWLPNISDYSKNGRCSYCQISRSNSLDHYLPKSEFPLLAISTWNLIPCCSECNTDISARNRDPLRLTTLHPYFIDSDYSDYIEAVYNKRKNIINFNISKNIQIQEGLISALNSHFNTCKLSKKWDELSVAEISYLSDVYESLINSGLSDQITLNNEILSYLDKISRGSKLVEGRIASKLIEVEKDFIDNISGRRKIDLPVVQEYSPIDFPQIFLNDPRVSDILAY